MWKFIVLAFTVNILLVSGTCVESESNESDNDDDDPFIYSCDRSSSSEEDFDEKKTTSYETADGETGLCGGNATKGCDSTCSKRCLTYNRPYKCRCPENSCECKDGYLYDDYSMSCVRSEDCNSMVPEKSRTFGTENAARECSSYPNAEKGCDSKCQRRCPTSRYTIEKCACPIGSCRCKMGYYFDIQKYRCVCPNECSNVSADFDFKPTIVAANCYDTIESKIDCTNINDAYCNFNDITEHTITCKTTGLTDDKTLKTTTEYATSVTKDLTTTTEDLSTTTKNKSTANKDVTTTTENISTTTETVISTTENLSATTENLSTTTEDMTTTIECVTKTTENLLTTTENVLTTTEGVTTTTETESTTIKEEQITTEEMTTTTECVTITTENLLTTTENVAKTTENVSTTTEEGQTTTENVSTTTGYMTTSTKNVPTTTEAVTTTTENVSTTTEEGQTTFENMSTTTGYVTTSTGNVPTTSEALTTTTENVLNTTENETTITENVPTTTENVSTTTEEGQTTSEDVSTTSEYVTTSNKNVPTTTEILTTTTENMSTTTEEGQTTTENISTTTGYMTTATENVPTTTEALRTTTENVFKTTEYETTITENVPTITENVPTKTEAVTTTTENVLTTTEEGQTTTENMSTTTGYVTSSTENVPTTSEALTTTTENVLNTTENETTITENVPTTTEAVATTTENISTTIGYVTTSTDSVPTTTENISTTTENGTTTDENVSTITENETTTTVILTTTTVEMSATTEVPECPDVLGQFEQSLIELGSDVLYELTNTTPLKTAAIFVVSLAYIIATLKFKAEGITNTELSNVIGVPYNDELRCTMTTINQYWPNLPSTTTASVENIIAVNVSLTFSDSFEQIVTNLLRGQAANFDPEDQTSIEMLNNEIASGTNGLIDNVIPSDIYLNSSTEIVLLTGAIYETQITLNNMVMKNGDFLVSPFNVQTKSFCGGKQVMNSTESNDLQAKVLQIQLDGDQTIVIVLPKSKLAVKRVLTKITENPGLLKEAIANLEEVVVDIRIPVINTSTLINFRDILEKTELVPSIFDSETAEYKGFVEGDPQLAVTYGYQRFNFGYTCEAAESEQNEPETSSQESNKFYASHPFIFCLFINKYLFSLGIYYG